MPKASTFVVLGHRHVSGVVPYLFLRFQHHSKAWAAGQFSINVITSARYGAPTRDVRKIGAFHRGEEGYFRIGSLTARKDKWWCLAPGMFDDEPAHLSRIVRVLSSSSEMSFEQTRRTPVIIKWRPSSFADEKQVFVEAIADVSADVRRVLELAEQRRRESPS